MRSVLLIFTLLIVMNCKTTAKDEMPLGGYMNQDIDTEFIQKAYQFTKTTLKVQDPPVQVLELKRAESRVVAGTQIRLYCRVSVNDAESVKIITVLEGLNGLHQVVAIENTQ